MASFQGDFAITCILFLCIQLAHQAINVHPDVKNPTYVSKESELNITWTFTDKVSDISRRSWSVNNGSADGFEPLGSITGDGSYDVYPSSPFRTELRKPATLILNNVSLHHNGTYRFEITPKFGDTDRSDVLVIIAEKPTAVIDGCSSPHIVEPGDNVTCLCKSSSGNPPPYAKWTKDGKDVGETGYLQSTLLFENITKENEGTYTCVVQSHTLKDEEQLEIRVGYKSTSKPTSTATTNSRGTVSFTEESIQGLATGAIVGIVVGVLFLILLVLFLVWWFKFRDTGRKNRSDSHQGMSEEPSPGPSRNVDENAYETPGTGAGTSRSSNQPSGVKSELPPVYSQVDMSKKTRKPPPTAQSPALTYSELDPVALQPDSSKMRERPREQSQYADIKLEKLQSDLV